MPTLTIDGTEIEVAPGTTLLQACEQLGIEIPRFCYHERLNIAGNCRMCLVEVEKAPKPMPSCAAVAGDNMVVHTDSESVRRARRAILEFLLINHPLDCPICDQGGECDLQDQTVAYGPDRSRFNEEKRAVADKYLGPLIDTSMTRCIQCTRCVRFMHEVAGVPELGAAWRGEETEITPYIEKGLTSELSGNIIDLCPVGALTNKPYAFQARPWELAKTPSIDVHDAVGSNVRVDSRGDRVLRILPREHEDVNEEWLSDKSRFACDGLARQRIDTPYIRGNDGRLHPARWDDALRAVADAMTDVPAAEMGAIVGDLVDCEAMTALLDLWRGLGSPHIDCRQDGAYLDASARAGYVFNSTIAGIEDADALLIVGSNPRLEAPVLNARIRKRWRTGRLSVGVIGQAAPLTYDYTHVGEGTRAISDVAKGDNAFAKVLKNAERPMVIVGMGALDRGDGDSVTGHLHRLVENCGIVRDDWNGFNVLHTAAARVGGLDLGLVPEDKGLSAPAMQAAAGKGTLKLLYLLGADEVDTTALGDAFVVYQGHHGDAGAARADVVLPGAAYTEKDATYVNTEGRPQRTQRAVCPPGEARPDWAILRALSARVGHTLPYDTLEDVRHRMTRINPVLGRVDEVVPADWSAVTKLRGKTPRKAPFESPVRVFYQTDAISRVSPTMAACVREHGLGDDDRKAGSDG